LRIQEIDRPARQAGNTPSTPVAVAIVNYNTREHLRACLATVEAEGAREVVVVDSASTDGSVEMVRERFPWVTLHANQTNPGYGAAANEAIAACAAPCVLLLNSDTRLRPGALAALGAYLDRHPRAGTVGPRLLNADGTLQRSCFHFPVPLVMLLRETALGKWIGRLPGLRDAWLYTWDHKVDREVPWILGAAMAIRRAASDQIGGFDTSFYMYYEEVDLCYRLRQAGWQVHFTPSASVEHVGGASTSQRRAEMEARLYASARHFYRQHYPAWWLPLLKLVVSYTMVRNWIRDRLRLRGVQEPDRQVRLAQDGAIWQRVLSETWREPEQEARAARSRHNGRVR
jgi:N-acetylglucosaminyl-diphospho-decaprenol L-rhamnosyltransferase